MMRRCVLLSPTLVLGLVVGCTGEAAVPGESTLSPGELSGEVIQHIADYEERSETSYALRLSSGEDRPLVFPGNVEIAPGTMLKVWGAAVGDTFAVSRWEALPLPPVATVQKAAVGGMPRPLKRWAFVIVKFNGTTNLTKAVAQDKLFNAMNPTSIRYYYREVSYGLQDLDGEVFEVDAPAGLTGCPSSAVASMLRSQVTGTFNQYLWYFGARQSCGWAGLAALGRADRPARDSWYNASQGCVVLVQEPGHNFGMVHSSSMRCANGQGQYVPIIAPGDGMCTHSEYGNPFDPMGSGCYHMNGPQKAYQDWLVGCNVVKATSSGDFTIFPLEKACNGVQVLQVPFPARTLNIGGQMAALTSYYVELRAPIGLDSRLMRPRVFITVAGEVRAATSTGGRNWLIDMKPDTSTVSDGDMTVGQTLSDPDPMGPKITLVSATNDKAVVRVVVAGGGAGEGPGKGICDDMSPFTAPGVETCESAPPTPPPGTGGSPGGMGGAGGNPGGMGGAGGAAGGRDAGAAGAGGAGGAGPTPTPGRDAGAPPVGGAGGGAAGAPGGTGGAGTGGAAGGGAAGAPGGTGGTAPPPPPGTPPGVTTGGCGCDVGSAGHGSNAGLALAGLFAAAVLARRRRRS